MAHVIGDDNLQGENSRNVRDFLEVPTVELTNSYQKATVACGHGTSSHLTSRLALGIKKGTFFEELKNVAKETVYQPKNSFMNLAIALFVLDMLGATGEYDFQPNPAHANDPNAAPTLVIRRPVLDPQAEGLRVLNQFAASFDKYARKTYTENQDNSYSKMHFNLLSAELRNVLIGELLDMEANLGNQAPLIHNDFQEPLLVRQLRHLAVGDPTKTLHNRWWASSYVEGQKRSEGLVGPVLMKLPAPPLQRGKAKDPVIPMMPASANMPPQLEIPPALPSLAQIFAMTGAAQNLGGHQQALPGLQNFDMGQVDRVAPYGNRNRGKGGKKPRGNSNAHYAAQGYAAQPRAANQAGASGGGTTYASWGKGGNPAKNSGVPAKPFW